MVRGAQETDPPKFLSQNIKTMSGPVSGDMCPNEVLRPKGKTDNQGPGDIEPFLPAWSPSTPFWLSLFILPVGQSVYS